MFDKFTFYITLARATNVPQRKITIFLGKNWDPLGKKKKQVKPAS